MIYDIEIDYTTGNSFGSERSKEMLGIITTDIDKAIINLKRIKAHTNELPLELLTDNDTRTIQPFWIGYFEELHGARIIINNDEMSFTL